ncbi:MAG TPA: hypothetical protein VFR08_03410, partial [Candidatus Angelobacter sp.]|nr:hypothetical protein [Candidatus Angelobacter sp.]
QIMGHDEGLEVIANQNNQQLEIVGNRITLNQIVGERWGAHFGHVGIFCSVNRDAVIKDNTIDLTGPGIGLVLSGENFRVEERNEVFLKPLDQDPNTYPLAGIVLGMNSTRSPIPAAPSLNDSIISGNIIHGKAYYAILTYDALNDAIPYPSSPPPPNQSHNNKIIFNSFPDFQPLYTSLLLRSGTHDNYCEGYFPSPGPDRPGYINEGTNNTVTLPTLPHPEPLPHAEVLRRAG